jgi:outer membrane murein-binding lipoprotein Lpp
MRKAIAVLACLTFILAACVSKADLQTAEKRASDLQAQVTSLQAQLAEKDTQITSGQAQLDELSSKVASLGADLTQAKKDLDQARRQASSLSSEVAKYKCSSQITNMNYDNVMTASTILSAWWSGQPNVESISTPYRDKIWSNAMTQIHGITFTSSEDHKPYVEHFLVYFDEFGWKPGVFWISAQCWLDPP